MRDRLSTKILSNGAVRYGVYDETGALLRYEYIKLEDEPSTEGDFFNKANMLPDSIPRLLGLKMENPQVKDALNVLANIGNVHVWERVQTYSEEVPAGYTLGEKESTKICKGGYSSNGRIIAYTGTEISVDKGGNVTLGGTTDTVDDSLYGFVGQTNLRGKYVRFKPHITGSSPESQVFVSGVFYVPNDANCTFLDGSTSGATSSTYGLIIDKLQAVKAYPYIPAGTTTDYLTSTDRNAYPDNVTDAQDAYYTLGDVVSGSFYIGSFFAGSNSAVQYMVSDAPFVDESGSVSISNGTKVTFSNSIGDPGTESDAIAKVKALFAGKYVMRTNDPEPDSSTMYFTLLPKNEVVYIPDDISVSVLTAITGGPNSMALSKYQPVTGHAAIPANTTITYLGQLGGGARIEVGSYVGTGTYGKNNPCSITLSKDSAIVFILQNGVFAGVLSIYDSIAGGFSLVVSSAGSGMYFYEFLQLNISVSGNTISWYHRDQAYQLNIAGYTYTWVALAIG